MFLTKQATQKPKGDFPQHSADYAPRQVSNNSSSAYNASMQIARQQEIYNDLIAQMSKELQDIQLIKQNLAHMASSISEQQSHLLQAPPLHAEEANESALLHSSESIGQLKHQQI